MRYQACAYIARAQIACARRRGSAYHVPAHCHHLTYRPSDLANAWICVHRILQRSRTHSPSHRASTVLIMMQTTIDNCTRCRRFRPLSIFALDVHASNGRPPDSGDAGRQRSQHAAKTFRIAILHRRWHRHNQTTAALAVMIPRGKGPRHLRRLAREADASRAPGTTVRACLKARHTSLQRWP